MQEWVDMKFSFFEGNLSVVGGALCAWLQLSLVMDVERCSRWFVSCVA